MSKCKESKKVVTFRCPEKIINRWDERAKNIGIDRTALILVGMNEYLESHPSSIEEKPVMMAEVQKEIKEKSEKIEKKRGRPSKSPKPKKKVTKKVKKTQKPIKVDKRKNKLEYKKCPICHESFECRGMGSHLRKHSRENHNKDTKMVKISQEKMDRLRQHKKYEDVGIHGREDYDIPSQILIKGNEITKKK